jgi:glucuronoarabinoxylan endo-1,4-beta-xylanase
MKKNKKAISFGYPTCVFLILILTLGTSYGDVNNILVNPGFETGTTGNWAARSCTFARTTSQEHSGSYSGLASRRTASWEGIQQDVTGKMVQDQTYVVSGWIRTNNATSTPVDLCFQKTDGNGTTYAWGASGTASSSGWTYISGSYTLTVNGTLTSLLLYVEGATSGTTYYDIYLDDVNVFGAVPGVAGPNATGQVNFTVTHQTLDGFGAAGAWYDSTLVALGISQPGIYNVLFGNLGLDIYRVRNDYNESDASSYMSDTATIVSNANASLGHPIRVLLSSWSPPAYLKSNGSTVEGTLAKVSGNYVYSNFAQWWADSLTAWSSIGVNPYYISMQNEPDYQNSGWDTCQFDPTEDSSYAGYEQAFAALYTKLNTLPSHPKLLAPEAANFTDTPNYISALTTTDTNNLYGYAHHPYDASASSPDGENGTMATFASSYGSKPIMMTEFSGSGPFAWTDAMNLAIFINNFMTIEGASGYLYWELFWSGNDALVTITSSSYTINTVYYAMMHYSRFTDPNWQRVDANTTSSNLRISAYKDPCEPNASIVIINTSTTTDMNLTLALNGFTPQNSGIYQSTSNVNFAYIGTFSTSTPVSLPKQSITTIHLAGFADCAAVQASGNHRLDSDLNGDCYVDYEDLAIIAYYWLHTDCTAPGNCQGADFAPTDGTVNFLDFADFGPQWMQCNNPLDANCTPNWE